MTTEQKILSRLRTAFALPRDIETRWGILCESHDDRPLEAEQVRPALLVGGNRLALDIGQWRFCTECHVLHFRRTVEEAASVRADEDLETLVITTARHEARLDLQAVLELYYTHRFSQALLRRVNDGQHLF